VNIYFQVLSQVQTADVARLLSLPAELQSGRSGCQLKMSAGGKIRTRSFGAIDEAVSHVQDAKVNQLEVIYSIANDSALRIPGNPLSVSGLFTVSPTCDLWFKADDWPAGGERSMRMRKINAKAAETALIYYKVDRKPSLFEMVIDTQTAEPQEKVLDACAGWLANFVPEDFAPLAVFGCVDAGGPEFFVKLESNILMTADVRIMSKLLPSAYPELGQKFEALHPVMFGSKKVCEGIGSALGKDAEVIPSVAINNFGVVRLKADRETLVASSRLSAWIFPPAAESTPDCLSM
jgi:hypothetical protein